MASLVADYDSSSNSGQDSEIEEHISERSDAAKTCSTSFFSLADNADENLDEDSAVRECTSRTDYQKSPSMHNSTADNENDVKLNERLPNPLAIDSTLPKPSFGTHDHLPSQPLSVFTNRYQKEEAAKQSILEQHVKLSATEMQQAAQGKKVCRLFLAKGKCRFGASCKYSHGNDISKQAQQEIQPPPSDVDNGQFGQPSTPAYPSMQGGYQGGSMPASQDSQRRNRGHTNSHYGYQSFNALQPEFEDKRDDDSYMASAKRKRRVGVSEGLVPPKKAMQNLSKFREEERPWTLPKY